MPELGEIVTATIGIVGAVGGLAALYRARSQNKTDENRLQHEQQQSFTAQLMSDVAALRAMVAGLSTDKDKLELALGDQKVLLVRLQLHDELKTQQIEQVQRKNQQLEGRVNEQQREIELLKEQKAVAVNQLQVAIAQREFVERENNELRRELLAHYDQAARSQQQGHNDKTGTALLDTVAASAAAGG